MNLDKERQKASRKRRSDHTAHSSRKEKQSSTVRNKHKTLTASTGVCEHVSDRYEKVGRVGEGTYGVVYKARDKQTGEYVALKRCIPHHESSDGFPLTTLRELHALRLCAQHPNVVQLQSVVVSSTNGVFIVFEYCPQDIAKILDAHYSKYHRSPFDESQVKRLSLQLLSALQFCHDRALLHRDIKPSNLLYDTSGQLKLADFGLSRHTSDHLTANVVSLWYRAPELLLQKGLTSYSTAIDMWATGCVVAELLQGFPLLDGKSELEQVDKMVSCFGVPPYGEYQGALLSNTKPLKKGRESDELWDRFEELSSEGLAFLTKLLEYLPSARWTASQAIDSDYFKVSPLPAIKMPRF